MNINKCRFFGHDYITKGSWSRCARCWNKPPKPQRLAPKKRGDWTMKGWKKGPVR